MLALPDDRLLLTVSLSGAATFKSMTPNVPEQPEEIAQAALECWNEGAAIIHIHARDKAGQPTGDPEVFQEIKDRIKAKGVKAIIQFSTGGGPNLSVEERMACLDVLPESASLNVGTLMRVSGAYKDVAWLNSRTDVARFAARMKELGIKPEMEIFTPTFFREVTALEKAGLIEKPYHVNLVLGMPYQGAIEATPKHLLSMLEFVPEDTYVNVSGVARAQLPLTTLAMILGCCVRVGMEDNIYYSKGVLAESNAQLAARTVRIARELGKEPCTPEEARKFLGIKQLDS
ncbi:MAG: 3-keto-5-aminohexanoate cleavage protein [Candidatus Melainabacteria bacterium HGW-Melainabacteria-1]|nr:MAG: 3-keto-5-aminohexanoate cleavage protein [Candidatus Melainabacteria bacterium HGW-Melainabacteria-1]